MQIASQKTAYLSLGSNIGDRAAFLEMALQQLRLRAGLTTKVSSVYETAAWGNTQQPAFYNQVLELLTPLGAEALLALCLDIEREMGRVRVEHWGARCIDIDILLYNNQAVEKPNLIIPHPHLPSRRFVLEPLCEIAPYVIHPTMGFNMQALLDRCTDELTTKRIQLA